jgi:hypothetical protein
VFSHGLACLLTVKLIEIKDDQELAKMIAEIGYSVYSSVLNNKSGDGREAAIEQYTNVNLNYSN